MQISFLPQCIQAGFPSPAEDYLEAPINIHDYLVSNPPATFLGRVAGDSMREAGIFNNDIVVIDRSLPVQFDQVVVASVEGSFVVKYLRKLAGEARLCAANDQYPDIRVSAVLDCQIWGVVTSVIRKL